MVNNDDNIEARLASNVEDVLGHGPGLRAREGIGGGAWVAAKDTTNGQVLLSGLGGMGVGSMWCDLDDRYHDYPGWDDAPEVQVVPTGPHTFEQFRIPDPEQRRAAWARTAVGMLMADPDGQ